MRRRNRGLPTCGNRGWKSRSLQLDQLRSTKNRRLPVLSLLLQEILHLLTMSTFLLDITVQPLGMSSILLQELRRPPLEK